MKEKFNRKFTWRTKAFTLIELLAVIVILAIIALIATPLIMNIINDSKQKTKERTYEAIEKGAEYYIMHEYDLDVEDSVLIPINELKRYVKNIPGNIEGEYVYVKNLGNRLSYYYTGRGKEDNNKLLKNLIEKESNMIKKNTKVNGKIVNKVIGSKDNKDNMKNHVWYSGYLWQALETNDDGIKMVMSYPVSSISFGTSTDYKTSYIREWLNEGGNFYDKLNRKDLLVESIICLDNPSSITTEQIELTNGSKYQAITGIIPIDTCNNKVNDKVGILTLEDYAYSYDGTLNLYGHNGYYNKKGGVMGYSFINLDVITWLPTVSYIENVMWTTAQYNPGFIVSLKDSGEVNKSGASVRPVITLSNIVSIKSGEGYANNPYIVDEGYSMEQGANLSKATVGEYLYIDEGNNPYESNKSVKENVKYRIIDIEKDGIKIEREEIIKKLPASISFSGNHSVLFYTYYDENVSSDLWCYYDRANKISYNLGCKNNNYMKNTGSGDYELYKGNSIGYFLNNENNGFYTWISKNYQNIIIETKWELKTISSGFNPLSLRQIGEKNNNGKAYPYSNYDGIYHAKISIPIYGDILSGEDQRYNYWYQNRWIDSTNHVSFSNWNGRSYSYFVSNSENTFTVRPIFYIKPDITISSGNGTNENPYRLNV